MGSLLGQVSKWRAQRADRGAHAARGFVGGATEGGSYEPEESALFQCRTRLCGWCNFEWRVQIFDDSMFQCRTRLCGWCNEDRAWLTHRDGIVSMPHAALWVVQPQRFRRALGAQSGFNAARGFVGGATCTAEWEVPLPPGFNAARGFVGGATASLAALVPLRGKSPFGKSPEI